MICEDYYQFIISFSPLFLMYDDTRDNFKLFFCVFSKPKSTPNCRTNYSLRLTQAISCRHLHPAWLYSAQISQQQQLLKNSSCHNKIMYKLFRHQMLSFKQIVQLLKSLHLKVELQDRNLLKIFLNKIYPKIFDSGELHQFQNCQALVPSPVLHKRKL